MQMAFNPEPKRRKTHHKVADFEALLEANPGMLAGVEDGGPAHIQKRQAEPMALGARVIVGTGAAALPVKHEQL